MSSLKIKLDSSPDYYGYKVSADDQAVFGVASLF